MKTLTESLIVALIIFIPDVVAERIDHELSEPESERVCSCDPHLEVYLEFTGQSFHLEKPTGDRMVGVVDGNYREHQGDLTKSATR